jgi:hypothetical protein
MSDHVVMISGDAHVGSFVGNWWGAEDYREAEFRERHLEPERANPPLSWTPDQLGFLQPSPGTRGPGGFSSEAVHDL